MNKDTLSYKNTLWCFGQKVSYCVLSGLYRTHYFIYNTYITHRLFQKKNGLPVRNIGFIKYFLTIICCVVILICCFLILSMGYIASQ